MRVSLNAKTKGEDLTASSKMLKAGDIVYNPMRLNIGSIGVVPPTLDGALASPDYVVARPTGISGDLLVTLLRSPFYKMYIDIVATGSIRDRFYFKDLKNILFPVIDSVFEKSVKDMALSASTATNAAAALAAEQRKKLVQLLHGIIHTREDKSLH